MARYVTVCQLSVKRSFFGECPGLMQTDFRFQLNTIGSPTAPVAPLSPLFPFDTARTGRSMGEYRLSYVNVVLQFVGAPTFSTADPFHLAPIGRALVFHESQVTIHGWSRSCRRPADMPGVTNPPRC